MAATVAAAGNSAIAHRENAVTAEIRAIHASATTATTSASPIE
jgi:hypothetical protein